MWPRIRNVQRFEVSKQRPIDELTATVTLSPALGEGPDAESGLPIAHADGASWHRGVTAEGESVLAFTARGDFAVDVADAGRRAFLVSAPALVPIREVGEFYEADGTPVTAVLYDDPAAPSLAEMTREGALRPETARAVAGQVAEALETARRRGVRHRFLDESRVFVDVDADTVRIIGAGVETAALDDSVVDADALAVNPDVRSIGRILFVGLAGRDPEFFGGADVVDPALASPRTVPDDLSAITRTLLTHEGSNPENPPYTVRAARSDLAPWQSLPVTLEAFDPDQHAGAPQPLSAAALAAMRGDTQATPPVDDGNGNGNGIDGGESGDADTADAAGAADTSDVKNTGDAPTLARGSDKVDDSSGVPQPDRDADSEHHTDSKRGGNSGPGAGAVAGTALAGAAVGAAGVAAMHGGGDDHQRTPDSGNTPDSDGTPDSGVSKDAHNSGSNQSTGDNSVSSSRSNNAAWGDVIATNATGSQPASAPDSKDDSGPIRVAGRTESLAAHIGSEPAKPDFSTRSHDAHKGPETAPTANPAPELAAKRPALVPPSAMPQPEQQQPVGVIPVKGRPLNNAPARDSQDESPSLLRDVVGVAFGSDAAERQSTSSGSRGGTESKVILVAAILALVLALVFALTSITSVNRDRDVTSAPTTEAATTPAEKSPEASKKSEEPKEEPGAAAPSLQNVEVVYPEDPSKADNPEKAGDMKDGNAETVWKTQRYNGPDYGRLRDGMGVRLSFADTGKVSEVGVTAGEQEGGTIEVRPVDDNNEIDDPVGSGTLSAGKETVIKLDKPVEAKELVLWAPDLGAVDGGYRLEIAEVRVG